MVQTQLASMYLGNPLLDDAESRLTGVNTLLNAQIHILDGQSNQGIILDYITAKNIIEDNHKKSLEDTLETYDFITFADKRFSQYLEKRNRIIIPDEDGSLVEFVIFEAAKYKDSEGYKAQVFTHASYLELKKASILYPDNGFKGSASQQAGRVLNGTGWQVGIVEGAGNKTLTVTKHTNPYEQLKHIAKEYKLELRFRITHNGNQVTGRYVDLLERVGEWRGREVEFGKDLDSIRRVEKQDIVTALLGLGPEREDGTRIEVLIEDDDALKRWGRVDEHGNLNHLIEPYEIESEREEMTTDEARRYTKTALNKRINEQVKYETTIIDLEHVLGMENKKIRFGDSIRIKDTEFNPPLYLEARVFEQNRSIKSQAKKDIKLGDYQEFTEEEVNIMWTMLRREIRKKIDIDTLQEYAEPKKIESDTPPEIKDGENPIWVDTSKTPAVSHVVIAGRWVKMTPTTPAEVDAYTKSQVDSKDTSIYNAGTSYADQKAQEEAAAKAAQALADAKAFSRNASNINSGVINVGAIPLRTSITGARLEWDGVNGLVQYDSSGNPVSWLDLDANAHFSNGYFSGEIHAHSGTFKGDVTGASGTFSGDLQGSTIRGSQIILNRALNDSDGIGLTGTYNHIDNRYNRGGNRYDGTINLNSAYLSFRSKTTLLEGTPMHREVYQISDFGANSIDVRRFRTSSNNSATGSFRGNEVATSLSAEGIEIFKGGTSSTNTTWDLATSIMHNGIATENITLKDGRIYSGDSILRVTSSYIVSMRFYDRTSTATSNQLRVTANGVVNRSTSSRRYKLVEENIPLEHAKKLLEIDAKTWYDKVSYEKYCDEIEGCTLDEDDEIILDRLPGYIAEDVHDVGLTEFVSYNEKNEPDGISANIHALYLPLIKDLYNELEELKNERSII